MLEAITRGSDILSAICEFKNKWGIMISFDPGDVKFTRGRGFYKDAPWLTADKHFEIMMNGVGYFFADSREEIDDLFKMTKGDDSGGKCYALTCGPDGRLCSENT
jgi:hypothetical protein